MSRARLAQLLAIAALTAGLALAFRASREPSLNLTYAQATRGELQREVLTSGTLEPAKEVETGSQVSGTIQALHADFNSRVTAGQIVAELDPSVYDTELAQARARVIQADAEAHHAQLAADDASVKAARARELAAGDLITRAELDAAGLAAKESAAALVAARAAAKAARAAQELAQVQRERTTIRSPIDGVVVSRNVEVGQTLAASFESPVLFRIADLRRMRLLVEVGEGEVGGVQTGTPVTFEIESLPGQQFKGTVAEVRLQPLVTQSGVGTGGAAGASQAQPTATSGASTASASSATVGGQQPASATAGSASRAQPSSAQGAASGGTQGSTSGTTQAPSPGTPTAPAGGVVSYTAIIDVDNSDHRITPGSSAVVTLPTARRSNAIRIPNNALSFRPAPDVLAATGQASLEVRPPDPSTDSAKGRERYVWKYEDGKFVPIAVRVGVSDERWTELIEGPIEEGVPLVTTAARAR